MVFEITHRCNLKCNMCGHYGEAGVNPKYRDELSIPKLKIIIDDISSFSPFVTITGGEPFIRKDIMEILWLFKEKNISFGLLTNGTLINSDIAHKLAIINPSYMNISVDGPKEIHEQIRGNNTFDRTINAIKLLQNAGCSNLTINCVISKLNFEYLEEMADLADQLKVKIQFQHLQFTSKKRNDDHREIIKKYFNIFNEDRTSGTLTDLIDFDVNILIEQIEKVKRNSDIKFMPNLRVDEIGSYYTDIDNYTHSEYCLYPWREARINPYGEMVYCIMEPTAGSLLSSTFENVWNNKYMQYFRKVLKCEKLFPNCARCCKI
jgi:MoaA/NifB/PqqE/SkfB family radical SAM enzyme